MSLPRPIPFSLPAPRDGASCRRAHAMGVCGVGVAGVAAWLARTGWKVTGCDADADGATADWLRRHGVEVFPGHDVSHVDAGCDLLVRTAAVPADHPEVRRAVELGIPTPPRGIVLAALLDACRSIAVCGTHGKTTTTAFTARLLRALGEDAGWCIGGTAEGLDGFSGGGTHRGSIVVAESDESDGTLAAYHPYLLVVTNIGLDHMEHFADEAALLDCFATAARNTRHAVLFGADSRRAAKVAAASPVPSIGFGFAGSADLRATGLRLDATGTTFSLAWRGMPLGDVRIDAPGRHNVLNATAAAAAAIALGHEPHRVAAAMASLGGLPGRRFDTLVQAHGIRVVSDYSHHPDEIRALVEIARLQGAKRILALFQPHRFTRTKALGRDFPAAFEGVDGLILAPVFAASEPPLDGGHATDLYRCFRESDAAPTPLLAPSLDAARDFLRRTLREGDLLLVIGAGNVAHTARDVAEAVRTGGIGGATPIGGGGPEAPETLDSLAEALRSIPDLAVVRDAPMGLRTGYGVGGKADFLVESESEEALSALLALLWKHGIPWEMLGAGMNRLVGDLGPGGVAIRLACPGAPPYELRDGGDGEVVASLGAAWSGPALLDRLERDGLSGLEFLEGVPGVLGGWLAMNAGAQGDEIGRHVARIRCLNADGRCGILSGDTMAYGYRHCGGLAGRIALSADIRLRRAAPGVLRERRAAFRAKRIDLRGLRTCGSVFRNPEGAPAGRMLDEAGCKGLRVGGAEVLERHANVIAAGEGATASDVLALMDIARRRVKAVFGVGLSPEVRIADRAPWPGCE
ncbi:MAG: UDP-N-acetylmuramate--L-alanine ligase [Kiritimatiellia bacterium]|jgi:UDP-N-acetylmuramate--alanine ligase